MIKNQFKELKELKKKQFNEFINEIRRILESVSLLASIQTQVNMNKTNSASIETSVRIEVKAIKEPIEMI